MKNLTFKTVFLLALGSGKRRSEIPACQNRNIRHQSDWSNVTLNPHLDFFARTSWPKSIQTVCPKWLFQPWLQLWICHSNLIGPYVLSEICALLFGQDLRPQAEQGVLSPLRKALTKTFHLPLSPHGSKRL